MHSNTKIYINSNNDCYDFGVYKSFYTWTNAPAYPKETEVQPSFTVCCDVDGTLIDYNDNNILPTIALIKQLKAIGCHITIHSGSGHTQYIKPKVEQAGLLDYVDVIQCKTMTTDQKQTFDICIDDVIDTEYSKYLLLANPIINQIIHITVFYLYYDNTNK